MKDTLYPIFLRAVRNGTKREDIANDVTEALNSAIKTVHAENANLARAAGLLNEYLGEDANITLEDLKAFCAGHASRTTASPKETASQNASLEIVMPAATPNGITTSMRKTNPDDSTIWNFVMSL